MTTLIPEENTTAATTASSKKPKPNKKARVAPRRAHVASSKAKSGKKPTSAKKSAKGARPAKAANKASGAHQGSKTEKVLDLLKRAGGASLKDIMKATDWQAHSVRGFLSGTIGKKMGVKLESIKREDAERVYSLAK